MVSRCSPLSSALGHGLSLSPCSFVRADDLTQRGASLWTIWVQPRFFSLVTATFSPGASTARTGEVSSASAYTSAASDSMTYMYPEISFSASASFGSGARSALRLSCWLDCRAEVMRSPRSPAEAWATTGLEAWLATTAVDAPMMVRSPAAGSTRWAIRRRRWACAWAWARDAWRVRPCSRACLWLFATNDHLNAGRGHFQRPSEAYKAPELPNHSYPGQRSKAA